MQRLGKVEDWNDERGYGFIAPLQTSEGGGKTFFHGSQHDRLKKHAEIEEGALLHCRM